MSKEDIIAVIIANSYRGAPVFFLLFQGALFQQSVLNFILFSLQGLIFFPFQSIHFKQILREGVKKHRYLTVRLTARGGRGAGLAPSALTVSKCENYDPFLALRFDSLIPKTHLSHCMPPISTLWYQHLC